MRAVPDEVFSRITPLLGDDGARAHLRAALTHTSSLTLRAQTLRTSREALRDRLVEELPGATVTLGALSPWSLRVEGAGDPTRAPSWREGLFSIQDEAAQAVAAMTEARPGMRVLDVCAGRGGKTAAIATMLAGDGLLHAVDLHPEKLAKAREELARLGLDDGVRFAAFAADLSVGLGALAKAAPSEGYDVVLVDAPCSGLGTLARRPDAMLRLRDPAALDALVASQRAILERVAPLVKVGGALVWAVCTLTREEGDGVIDDVARAHPAYFGEVDARRVFTADRDGTDGFVAHRRVRAGAW
ncbi:MAG: RsmB/NOP family class I SAM-dependent RNA methyltransferase, partial [Polyangiales bacterium]